MVAKESPFSNPSVIKLLEEATESHVSPYLNNAHTDHECFSLHIYVIYFFFFFFWEQTFLFLKIKSRGGNLLVLIVLKF